MAENTTPGAHILVFPYPAQGHMLPLLDFTHQLALQDHLTITILITPKNLPLLTPLLSTHPSIQTLILPFPHSPSIPPGVENVRDLPGNNYSFAAMMRALGELYNPILHWFKSHPSPPTIILSDYFLGWTHHLACQLSIPRLVFSPSGAFTLSITSELWRSCPKRVDSNDPDEIISFPKLPDSPNCHWRQLFPLYRSYRQGDPDSEFLRDGFLANSKSWGVVFNSYSELESVYLDHMKEDMGHERVWTVGPLSAGSNERGGSDETSILRHNIMSWLDTCNNNSVVYVCFGSQAVLTNKQMEELAIGLEKSGARFIWSFKKPTVGHVLGEYGMIPGGFEDRVVGRGLLINGWAPQVSILKHRAVGSFLTHCGWNSVLESLVAGVPMLAWPMGADQFISAMFLVDQVGVATRVCEGDKTIPNATELALAVAKSVSESGFEKERTRAMELKKAALSAVEKDGSSFKDLDSLVKDMCCLKLNRKI